MARKRLSNIDTLMLRVDGPANPNMGTGVMVFGAPVDFERVKATLEGRLLCYERFRQRVVQSRRPWGSPYWEADPNFDLGYHLQRVTLYPPADQAALQDLVSMLAGKPLDPDRPLWQAHLVDNFDQGCALIVRVHHALADGVALIHVLLSVADADPQAGPGARSPGPRGLPSRRQSWRRVAGRLVQALADPPRVTDLARLGEDVATSAWELLFSQPDSGCVSRSEPAESKRAAWSAPIPLAQVKTVGVAMGGTVNDILLTATAGALRRCLQAHGEPLVDSTVRAMVPVSFRTPGTEGELGNRIGVVLLTLPVGIPEPAERLRELKRRMDELKGSVEAPMVYAAMRVFGSAPSGPVNVLVDNLGDRATAIVTNVKGPRERLYLAGAPLEGFMFWTPRLGGVGLGVSIMSYDGQVRVGAITDEGTEFGPEVFIASFHEEFDALLAGALDKQGAHQRSGAQQEPATVKEMSALLDAALVTLDRVIAVEGAESRDEAEPATARCQALTQAGHPCKNQPQPGSSYGHVHA